MDVSRTQLILKSFKTDKQRLIPNPEHILKDYNSMSQRGVWRGHLDYPVILSLQLLYQAPEGTNGPQCPRPPRLRWWERSCPAAPGPPQPRGTLTHCCPKAGDPVLMVLTELNHQRWGAGDAFQLRSLQHKYTRWRETCPVTAAMPALQEP